LQICFCLEALVEYKNVPVLLNCKAGPGHAQEEIARLRRAFEEAGLEADVVACHGQDVREAAREALKAHPAVLVAAGGDGTLSAVAGVVSGTRSALGVVPSGTLNHFAKDLGIPLDAVQAAKTIAAGRRISVDVGEVNGRCFINNASLGLYPGIVRERARQQQRLRRSKRWAMLWATLAVLDRPPLLELRLEVDGHAREIRAPFVFVGNNDYEMEGFNVGTRARLDAGLLDIYTTRRCSSGGLLMLALHALFGRLRQADDFLEASARELRVASRRRQLLVATDGEVVSMQTPLEFVLRPRALEVIVP
jgi:YegS/Rv2252/BmrU family lipid kinase